MANHDIPDYPVKRPRFFNTQFLIDQDFIDDDAFQIAHERAFLRTLCVAGVCEGLSVTYPSPGKPPSIGAGIAIDSKGRMIVVGGATDAAARPDALADGDYFLHISFRETEDDMATGQSAPDFRRWKQAPAINVTAKPAAPPDGAVVLGSCTVRNKAFVGAGSLIGRQYSGLRLPGAGTTATATLRNTGVADDLAVLGGALAIRRDAAGQIGPTLTLQNAQTTAGTGGAIDFSRFDPGSNAPALRVQSLDDGNFSSHLVFATKQPGAAGNGLVERLRLTSDGALRFAADTPKDKLVAFDNGTERYGLGLNTGNLNLFCPAAARFSLRQGSATGTEVFTVSGTGAATFAGPVTTAGNLAASGTVSWGDSDTRTETRDDAGLAGNAGARSGFFQTSSPVNFPPGASNWWHLLDVRHSNAANNYALQIAGSFFDQELWFRKTLGGPTTAWRRVVHSDASGNVELAGNLSLRGAILSSDLTLRRHLVVLGTTDGSSASAHEVVGGIGFVGFGQSHGQLSYRAGDGFELINCSANGPRVGYGVNDYPLANLKANEATLSRATFPQASGGQSVSLYFESGAGHFVIYPPAGNGVWLEFGVGWHLNSDAALKTQVAAHEPVLDRVLRLRPVRFAWAADGKPSSGFIAQEVEALFPDLVGEGSFHEAAGRRVKGLPYERFAVLAIAALQELEARHAARLDALERALAARTHEP